MKAVMLQNEFLRGLPRDVLEKFDSYAEIIQVKRGDTDNEQGVRGNQIYFPLSCVYSLELPMSDGFSSHLGLLGHREAIGARNLVDLTLPGISRAIIPGYALRMRSEIFAAEMAHWPEVRRAVHAQFVRQTGMLGITSGCNLRHPLYRRLARWLLGLQFASGATCFELTHEDLAHFLGVRREAVTEVLSRLAQTSSIKTSRGRLEIVDAVTLRGNSCECSQAFNVYGELPAREKARLRVASTCELFTPQPAHRQSGVATVELGR